MMDRNGNIPINHLILLCQRDNKNCNTSYTNQKKRNLIYTYTYFLSTKKSFIFDNVQLMNFFLHPYKKFVAVYRYCHTQ